MKASQRFGVLGVGLAISLVTAACGASGNPVGPGSAVAPAVALPPPAPAAPAAGTITVSGVVFEITERGRVPIKDAYVEACGYASAETDKDGLFTIEVPADFPSLFVQAAGFAAVPVAIAPHIEVRMEHN
jgi:hypothetical protein